MTSSSHRKNHAKAMSLSDSDSFERLFDRYFSRVSGFFRKRGCTTEECQDLTQETFLQIHRYLPQFRGHSRVETWLFRLAANTYLKELRRRRAEKRRCLEVTWDGEEPAFDAFEDPDQELLEKEERWLLWSAIRCLPPKMRLCVQLRIAYGLEYAQIATTLDISIQTVKAHLFQAKERLKESRTLR